jgi:hypothetical protein
LILRLDPETEAVERMETPGGPLLFGVRGTDSGHIWAVGGVWAAGGNLSIRLDEGVLAYAGPAAIGRLFEATSPCRNGAAKEVTSVSYERDIAPLFVRRGCTSSACHGGTSPVSRFTLRTYDSTFGPGEEAEALGLCNVVRPCLDAADANDDGRIRLDDGIYPLACLFRGSSAPATPFPACGGDPTADALGCLAFERCER